MEKNSKHIDGIICASCCYRTKDINLEKKHVEVKQKIVQELVLKQPVVNVVKRNVDLNQSNNF